MLSYIEFTDDSRQLMKLANQEAQKLNHEYIGTEHMLLAICRPPFGLRVLGAFGIDTEKVIASVLALCQAGPEIITLGKLPQTPRARSVLAIASEEAGPRQVTPEHILLGLLKEEGGVASLVLRDFQMSYAELKAIMVTAGSCEPQKPEPEDGMMRMRIDKLAQRVSELEDRVNALNKGK